MSRRADQQAIIMARRSIFDLVEVSPDAKPPVARFLTMANSNIRNRKRPTRPAEPEVIEIKEIKMRPMIDDPDYDVKMKAIKGSSRKVTRSRSPCASGADEMAHQELGQQLLDRVKKDTGELAKVESEPRFEGRQIVMVLAPR